MTFFGIKEQRNLLRTNIESRIQSVLDHCKFISGPEVYELEDRLTEFCGVGNVVSCGNGTDALWLALTALESSRGQAVFVPSFTFTATVESIPLTGATPVLVDVKFDSFNIDINSLKRAYKGSLNSGLQPAGIIAVDLFGLPADYTELKEFANENGLWLISDSAQGFGSEYRGSSSCSFPDVTTTSFFPTKPLGCYGDGGAVITSKDELAEIVRSLKAHGIDKDKFDSKIVGRNSRLDTLQAAILLEKLVTYSNELTSRRKIAETYKLELDAFVDIPLVPEYCESVWAQYTIKLKTKESRDNLVRALNANGIPANIYYPTPIHKQEAYSQYPIDPGGLSISEELSDIVLSLPINAYLNEDDQQQVIDTVKGEFA